MTPLTTEASTSDIGGAGSTLTPDTDVRRTIEISLVSSLKCNSRSGLKDVFSKDLSRGSEAQHLARSVIQRPRNGIQVAL